MRSPRLLPTWRATSLPLRMKMKVGTSTTLKAVATCSVAELSSAISLGQKRRERGRGRARPTTTASQELGLADGSSRGLPAAGWLLSAGSRHWCALRVALTTNCSCTHPAALHGASPAERSKALEAARQGQHGGEDVYAGRRVADRHVNDCQHAVILLPHKLVYVGLVV